MAVSDPTTHPENAPRISVLGRFAVTVGSTEVVLPTHAQRVLAYLCVDRRTTSYQSRSLLAERLWPATSTPHAHASLRTALWRIRRGDARLIQTRADAVRLGPAVDTDLRQTVGQADRLLSGDPTPPPGDIRVESLLADLLPGWEDDWLVLERERVLQLRIHALDELSRRLCAQGRFAQSIDVALAAIAAEPMRESSHMALVAAYAAEGNIAAARAHFHDFGIRLRDELGVLPSGAFLEQMRRLRTALAPEATIPHRAPIRPRRGRG